VYPVVTCFAKEPQGEHAIVAGRQQATRVVHEPREFSPEKLDLLPGRLWGFLLNDKLDLVERVVARCEPLTSAGKINATSTAGEAERFHPLIETSGDGYRLINTGTIDPWVSSWGVRALLDKGERYLAPRLPKTPRLLGARRHGLYGTPKIVVAKTALRVEAFFDEFGDYASINTNCIHSFSEHYAPKYVLGWLHSKLFHYAYTCFFDAIRMSGGYLAFSAPMLRSMHIFPAPRQEQAEVVRSVDEILAAKVEGASLDVSLLEARVDALFFEMLGLSDRERGRVQREAWG